MSGAIARMVMRKFYREAADDPNRLPWHREDPGPLLELGRLRIRKGDCERAEELLHEARRIRVEGSPEATGAIAAIDAALEECRVEPGS